MCVRRRRRVRRQGMKFIHIYKKKIEKREIPVGEGRKREKPGLSAGKQKDRERARAS